MADTLSMADAASLETFAHETIELAANYNQDPDNPSAVASMLASRGMLAEFFERLSDSDAEQVYSGILGQAYQALSTSGLRLEECKTEAEESHLLERLERAVAAGWSQPRATQSFLALSLYRYPHELPRTFDLPSVPAWFMRDFVVAMLKVPLLFRGMGESEDYVEFIRSWMKYLAEGVAADPTSAMWQEAVRAFVQNANLLPLCSSGQNVMDICSYRADLLEHGLRIAGQQVDYKIPPRSSNQTRIRIGVLAQAFTPLAETAASLPLYEHLDPKEFEVTLYCLKRMNHPMEEYCRGRAHALKLLPPGIRAQVDFLRAEQLDILFFATNVVAGTDYHSLLAAHRLARVQATSIFSIFSTGYRHMDFYVSGTQTDPSLQAQTHYRERLLQMEGSVHCFSYPLPLPASPRRSRSELGIDKSSIVFTSGANLFKLRREMYHVWARILARTPGSALLLFPYGPNWTTHYPKKAFTHLIAKAFADHGVDAERLIIYDAKPAPSREGIRELMRLADVYLDSFPFGGSTSLIEPLEVGLPVVVQAGEQLRSAMAPAMLLELGMPDLIAADEDAYIELACALAGDIDLRNRISERLRNGMAANPRFLDSAGYAKRIAPIYRKMANLE